MPQRATPPSKPHKLPSKRTPAPKSQHNPEESKEPSSGAASASASASSQPNNPLPVSTQQAILNHFSTSLSLSSESVASLQRTIQTVKSYLYARDFSTAFGSQEFLHAYAARWSPSRSLGYAQLVLTERTKLGLKLELDQDLDQDSNSKREAEGSDAEPDRRTIVCLGGGAGAELVGLAASLGPSISQTERVCRLKLVLVDSAPWASTLQMLGTGLDAFLPAAWAVEYEFHQIDLLDAGQADVLARLLAEADLITVFFTLNELYATGLAATTKFLLELGEALRSGTKLCVVDSAGSYAGVSFEHGSDDGRKIQAKDQAHGKRYPMAWMLDHTLLELASKGKQGKLWRKVMADESRWFRREKACEYPLQLEDMRYQVHIFERV